MQKWSKYSFFTAAVFFFTLGLPFYGQGWKTENTDVPGQATGPSDAGLFTGQAGILSYYEVLNCF